MRTILLEVSSKKTRAAPGDAGIYPELTIQVEARTSKTGRLEEQLPQPSVCCALAVANPPGLP